MEYRSFFSAKDWIFEHEKTQLALNSAPVRSTHKAKPIQAFRLPSPYLINRTLAGPQSRKMLLTALRTNTKSFYYYKQRRLYPPKMHPIRPPSPVTQAPRARSVLARPRACSRYQQTKSRTESRSSEQAVNRVVEKCEEVPSTRDLSLSIDKERSSLRELTRSLDWTESTLQDIASSGPDLQIPYYLMQKEARRDLESDMKAAAEAYRHSVNPVLGAARFERVLRKHKMMIL